MRPQPNSLPEAQVTSFQLDLKNRSNRDSNSLDRMQRQQPNSIVTTFQLKGSRRKRTLLACDACRKSHRRCSLNDDHESKVKCARCEKFQIECLWKKPPDPGIEAQQASNNKRSLTPEQEAQSSLEKKQKKSIFQNELIYANAFNSDINSQFVTTSQPLAPILSRDSFLCLEGEVLGLYYPWRDLYNEGRDSYKDSESIDPKLYTYLKSKGALKKPALPEQRKLIKLYLENHYPLYPVVSRDILSHIKDLPLLLLNSIFLVGIRYDKSLKGTEFRIRAEEFYQRCKLLTTIETNKITLIQSFLLMSTHEEGPEGPNNSREWVSRAGILCAELGLHNFGANNQFDILKNDSSNDRKQETLFKLSYNKGLLIRLFWTCFTADRLLSATATSPMFFNLNDLIGDDEPGLDHFDTGKYQESDFKIFRRWFSLSKLLERVMFKSYRPPKYRTIDDTTIEVDLLQWEVDNLNDENELPLKYLNYFKTAYGYCNMLYLRCKLDFFSFLNTESNESYTIDQLNPISSNKMFFVEKISNLVIDSIKSSSLLEQPVESILIVHAIIHVVVIIHLEIQSKVSSSLAHDTSEMNDETISLKVTQFNECLQLLESFNSKWWYSAACYFLFKKIIERTPETANASSNVFNANGNSDGGSAGSSSNLTDLATFGGSNSNGDNNENSVFNGNSNTNNNGVSELLRIRSVTSTQELLSSVFEEGKLFLDLDLNN